MFVNDVFYMYICEPHLIFEKFWQDINSIQYINFMH